MPKWQCLFAVEKKKGCEDVTGNILIVEDDRGISDLIKLNLNMVGYKTDQSYDGEDALERIRSNDFDLIILDVMIPKLDGFEMIEKMKGIDVPVIFLTAREAIMDKVKGLKLGAEDYMTKPFEAIELLARIEVVLRRSGKRKRVHRFKQIEMHLDERIVTLSGRQVELTAKEFELFKFLVENKGIALPRERILEKIWGYDYFGETRTVDMHVQRLRRKLELKDEIKTVFKIGYRLEV